MLLEILVVESGGVACISRSHWLESYVALFSCAPCRATLEQTRSLTPSIRRSRKDQYIAMNEYTGFLGSAAVGSAAALMEAGGHSPAKAKRRASSERRASTKQTHPADRPRSPGHEAKPDVRTEVAARAILAPLYVEPGREGDTLGVEGRHRNNMEQLFGYLAHM